jgi:hypothetical protein
MKDKNTPAFPFVAEDESGMMINMGMTLRDYFAAKAMQAIVSRGIVNEVPLEIYATNAYKMADAMLKAREA